MVADLSAVLVTGSGAGAAVGLQGQRVAAAFTPAQSAVLQDYKANGLLQIILAQKLQNTS